MNASLREKARGREQRRRGKEITKEEKSGRRKRIAGGSKSEEWSEWLSWCPPHHQCVGTKNNSCNNSMLILLGLDSVTDKISRTAFHLWLYECLKKIISL